MLNLNHPFIYSEYDKMAIDIILSEVVVVKRGGGAGSIGKSHKVG